MDLLVRHTGLFFRIASTLALVFFCAFASTTLWGCLDIPHSPKTSQGVERINVYVSQKGVQDSSVLKIHPGDTATLKVYVYPRQYKKDLTFEWLNKSLFEDSPEIMSLGEGTEFKIPPYTSPSLIPSVLRASDKQGNSMNISFNVIMNSPPTMNTNTKPAQGDTLYGNSSTAFLFAWGAMDPDLLYDDNLSFTLIIDKKTYHVGNLTSIQQSGFSEGEHSFKIIVTDMYNDSDTLKSRNFFVIDTLGDQK